MEHRIWARWFAYRNHKLSFVVAMRVWVNCQHQQKLGLAEACDQDINPAVLIKIVR